MNFVAWIAAQTSVLADWRDRELRHAVPRGPDYGRQHRGNRFILFLIGGDCKPNRRPISRDDGPVWVRSRPFPLRSGMSAPHLIADIRPTFGHVGYGPTADGRQLPAEAALFLLPEGFEAKTDGV